MADQDAARGIYPIGKAVIGIVWLFATACFFAPLDATSAGALGRALFGVLAITHAIECLFFLSLLRRSSRSLPEELWQTFLFGIVHITSLRRELDGVPD